jgi:DNA uptake protein ComE-like DNA-binding protein
MKSIWVIALLFSAFLIACNQDTNKTRDDAARAASQLKQDSKVVGKELKKGAEEAGRQGKAVAEGVRQGLNSDSQTVDLNSASKDQLTRLPGINERAADRIITGRPYQSKDDLVAKKIISEDEYQKIQDKITAK